jgi:hypothetical protein
MDCRLYRRAWSFVLTTMLGAGSAAIFAIGSSGACAGEADVKTLVAQLGDEAFSIRESATNQLIRQGPAAKAELLVAAKDPDAEVRSRARQVLEKIVAAERKRQLQAFRDDFDGKEGVTMPGWSVFKKTIGGDPTARELFVKIQEAEPDLLEAFEKGPKAAGDVLRQKTSLAAASRTRGAAQASRQSSVSMGSALAMLFVGGEPTVSLTDEMTEQILLAPQSQEFLSALTSQGSPRREPCQRILGRWVARDTAEKYLPVCLAYSMAYDLKEGVIPAARTLKQPTTAVSKSRALVVLGRFGAKDELPLVEPFLKDAQSFVEYTGNNQPMQVQVRDVALMAAIQLSGQNPKDFGFERYQANERVPFNSLMIAFRSEKERSAAFDKWQAWQNGQKQAAREKAEPKTSIE